MAASMRSTAMLAGGVVGSMMMMMPLPTVDGHAFQIRPVSRQYLRTGEFNDG